MEHMNTSIAGWADYAQRALSRNSKSTVSEILNIIKYYGSDYAEKVYNRIKP